jgi:hypothetical protein
MVGEHEVGIIAKLEEPVGASQAPGGSHAHCGDAASGGWTTAVRAVREGNPLLAKLARFGLGEGDMPLLEHRREARVVPA